MIPHPHEIPQKAGRARADGRPMYYRAEAGTEAACFHCLKAGLVIRHRQDTAFLADPGNSPDGSGDIHTVCKGHLPKNAVIYDPNNNTCYDLNGASWRED